VAASRSVKPGGQLEIYIPLDRNRAGGVARRAARATRWLWSKGVYPSPSAVNMRMRGETRDCLNGIETKARNAVMLELGIQRQRRGCRAVERYVEGGRT